MKNTITITTEVQNINDAQAQPRTTFVVRITDDALNLSRAEFSISEFQVLQQMFRNQDEFWTSGKGITNRAQFDVWAYAIKAIITTKILQRAEGKTVKQTAHKFYVELSDRFIGEALGNLFKQYTIVAGEISQETV